ncbi:MAG: glycosyl hydrolase family 8, partial [Mucilaginibacter sp.]
MKKVLILLIVAVLLPGLVIGQNKKKAKKHSAKAAFQTGVYPDIFLKAGYSQADIDNKVSQAYYEAFEGPDRVFFKVGDTMGYVTDIKNHDARTEGLSYGMMIAVQLDKKDVFDRIWRFSKTYLQHQDGP